MKIALRFNIVWKITLGKIGGWGKNQQYKLEITLSSIVKPAIEIMVSS